MFTDAEPALYRGKGAPMHDSPGAADYASGIEWSGGVFATIEYVSVWSPGGTPDLIEGGLDRAAVPLVS